MQVLLTVLIAFLPEWEHDSNGLQTFRVRLKNGGKSMKRNICGNGLGCENCASACAANEANDKTSKTASESKSVKKPFYKKWWFWIIVVVAVIGAIGCFADDADTSSEESIEPSSSETTESGAVLKSIGAFDTKEYSLKVTESAEITVRLEPNGISAEDIVISADSEAVGISDISLSDIGLYTELSFKCNAVKLGTATVKVGSVDGKIISDGITVNVTESEKIKGIGKFTPAKVTYEVGDEKTVTVYMTPSGITVDDFSIVGSDTSAVGISNVQVKGDGDKTVLTFTVSALKAGSSEISVISADGKAQSDKLSVTVREKDTSRTVYVTPYGEKYHFSANCAGKNATETTLNKAKSSGKDACGKCAH